MEEKRTFGERDIMRILYCNLLKRKAFAGHKHFDSVWVHLLQELADVTLLWPEEEWYSDIDSAILNEVCNINQGISKRKFIQWRIWNKEPFIHLAINDRMEAVVQIKKVLELDEKNHYDYIIISTLDWLSFAPYFNRFSNPDRIFVISHSVEIYSERHVWPVFKRIKNHVNHIVMEKDGVEYLHRKYEIQEYRIHYIPHMLNKIDKDAANKDIEIRDVVGISNSNSNNEIKQLIELEEKTGFFTKNRIKTILRSETLEYKSQYLTVFSGYMGLPYCDYLAYYINAKVVILPFSTSHGIRSTGTIMDAFSQNIPVLGSPFATMRQYQKKFPSICKTYSNIEEFQELLLEMLRDDSNHDKEFRKFQEEHSDAFILNCFKETFI